MTNYTDYKFYVDNYKGDMPESDFNKLVTKASAEVRKEILDRDITGYEEEVQMATCAVTDLLYQIEQAEQRKSKLISSEKGDKVIASEQVADLSRTFANITNINDLDKEISNQKAEVKEEIRLYLINTGLLFRGV